MTAMVHEKEKQTPAQWLKKHGSSVASIGGLLFCIIFGVGISWHIVFVPLYALIEGVFALGIGMIAAGALLLWTAVAINWDEMPEEIRQAVTTIMTILSVALLVIGAILTFSAANPALGIALMILGAASLAAVVALNWESMPEQMKQMRRPKFPISGFIYTKKVWIPWNTVKKQPAILPVFPPVGRAPCGRRSCRIIPYSPRDWPAMGGLSEIRSTLWNVSLVLISVTRKAPSPS